MRSINIANYTLPEGKMWKFAYEETEFHDDYGNHYEIVEDNGEIKVEDKLRWLKMADNETLLSQYLYHSNNNRYGTHAGDIKIIKDEIFSRMAKKGEQ